jgi:hypothetical protein
MIEVVKDVTLGNGDVVRCYDMTHGFRVGVESGKIDDTYANIVKDGTDLSDEDIDKLRVSSLNALASEILRLTYPDAYDEDGNLRSLPDTDKDNSKKKV